MFEGHTTWLWFRGCLVTLLALAVLASLTGATSVVGQWIVSTLSLGTGLVSVFVGASNRKYRRKEATFVLEQSRASLKKALSADYEGAPFTSDRELILTQPYLAIAVDQKRTLLRIVDAKTEKVIDLRKVRRVEAITSNNLPSSGLQEAVAGGLLFGGAGAVTGALIGQQSKSISFIGLAIYLDDIEEPLVRVNFLPTSVPAWAGMVIYDLSSLITSLADQVAQWKSIIEICSPVLRSQTSNG